MSFSSTTIRPLRTAACLIIGDEVLNGKTVDTNSSHFARYCFSLGLDLKRIETIGDIESEIIEAAQRMSRSYDFVVTSGGIGPTHDDITYASLAKAFGVPLELHPETKERMIRISEQKGTHPGFDWNTPSPTLTARMRMAMLPKGCRVVYVDDNVWVPIAVVGGNVHVLPGVPKIFAQLLDGLKTVFLKEGRVGTTPVSTRILISTPMKESEVAEYLTDLQERVKERGVKVGSYPRWEKERNTVTLVGDDVAFLESLVAEVVENVQGRRVQVEGEDDEVPIDVPEGVVVVKEDPNGVMIREKLEKLKVMEEKTVKN